MYCTAMWSLLDSLRRSLLEIDRWQERSKRERNRERRVQGGGVDIGEEIERE